MTNNIGPQVGRLTSEEQRLEAVERAPRKASGIQTLIRLITADETEDGRLGYPASAFRRRLTARLGMRAEVEAANDETAAVTGADGDLEVAA